MQSIDLADVQIDDYRATAKGVTELSRYPGWALEMAQHGIRQAPAGLSRAGFDAEGEPEPFSLACVATSVLYILAGPVRRVRSPRRDCTSYGWKHRAERWGAFLGFAPYLANGDFVAACIAVNVPLTRAHYGTNAFVGLRLLETDPAPMPRNLRRA